MASSRPIQIVEEAPDQGGLADTRRAVDVAGHRPPPAHVRRMRPPGTRAARSRPTSGAARRGDGWSGTGELGLAGEAPQAAEHVAARGPRRGVPSQQVDAQRVQVVGKPGHQLARGGRLEPLLVHQHFEGPAQERRAAGERLVEHRADAVPVAGRRDGQSGRLLRRHVGDGAEDCGTELWCSPDGPSSAASPKSRITTRPCRVTSTFEGFRSRWSLPASWRTATPSASCLRAVRNRARPAGERPDPRRGARRARPDSRRVRGVRCRRRHPWPDASTAGERWADGPGPRSSPGPAGDRCPIGRKLRKSTPSTSSMVKNQLARPRSAHGAPRGWDGTRRPGPGTRA